MGKNVIQINGEITVNVDVSVKYVMYVKNEYAWNPANCKMENIQQVIWMIQSVIKCNEIVELYGKETNFNEK